MPGPPGKPPSRWQQGPGKGGWGKRRWYWLRCPHCDERFCFEEQQESERGIQWCHQCRGVFCCYRCYWGHTN